MNKINCGEIYLVSDPHGEGEHVLVVNLIGDRVLGLPVYFGRDPNEELLAFQSYWLHGVNGSALEVVSPDGLYHCQVSSLVGTPVTMISTDDLHMVVENLKDYYGREIHCQTTISLEYRRELATVVTKEGGK